MISLSTADSTLTLVDDHQGHVFAVMVDHNVPRDVQEYQYKSTQDALKYIAQVIDIFKGLGWKLTFGGGR